MLRVKGVPIENDGPRASISEASAAASLADAADLMSLAGDEESRLALSLLADRIGRIEESLVERRKANADRPQCEPLTRTDLQELERLLDRFAELEGNFMDGGFWLLPSHVERSLNEFPGLGEDLGQEPKRILLDRVVMDVYRVRAVIKNAVAWGKDVEVCV